MAEADFFNKGSSFRANQDEPLNRDYDEDQDMTLMSLFAPHRYNDNAFRALDHESPPSGFNYKSPSTGGSNSRLTNASSGSRRFQARASSPSYRVHSPVERARRSSGWMGHSHVSPLLKSPMGTVAAHQRTSSPIQRAYLGQTKSVSKLDDGPGTFEDDEAMDETRDLRDLFAKEPKPQESKVTQRHSPAKEPMLDEPKTARHLYAEEERMDEPELSRDRIVSKDTSFASPKDSHYSYVPESRLDESKHTRDRYMEEEEKSVDEPDNVRDRFAAEKRLDGLKYTQSRYRMEESMTDEPDDAQESDKENVQPIEPQDSRHRYSEEEVTEDEPRDVRHSYTTETQLDELRLTRDRYTVEETRADEPKHVRSLYATETRLSEQKYTKERYAMEDTVADEPIDVQRRSPEQKKLDEPTFARDRYNVEKARNDEPKDVRHFYTTETRLGELKYTSDRFLTEETAAVDEPKEVQRRSPEEKRLDELKLTRDRYTVEKTRMNEPKDVRHRSPEEKRLDEPKYTRDRYVKEERPKADEPKDARRPFTTETRLDERKNARSRYADSAIRDEPKVVQTAYDDEEEAPAFDEPKVSHTSFTEKKSSPAKATQSLSLEQQTRAEKPGDRYRNHDLMEKRHSDNYSQHEITHDENEYISNEDHQRQSQERESARAVARETRVPSYMRATAAYESRVHSQQVHDQDYRKAAMASRALMSRSRHGPTHGVQKHPTKPRVPRVFRSTTKINAMEDIKNQMDPNDVYVPLAVRIKMFEKDLGNSSSTAPAKPSSSRDHQHTPQPPKLTRPHSPKLLTRDRSQNASRLSPEAMEPLPHPKTVNPRNDNNKGQHEMTNTSAPSRATAPSSQTRPLRTPRSELTTSTAAYKPPVTKKPSPPASSLTQSNFSATSEKRTFASLAAETKDPVTAADSQLDVSNVATHQTEQRPRKEHRSILMPTASWLARTEMRDNVKSSKPETSAALHRHAPSARSATADVSTNFVSLEKPHIKERATIRHAAPQPSKRKATADTGKADVVPEHNPTADASGKRQKTNQGKTLRVKPFHFATDDRAQRYQAAFNQKLQLWREKDKEDKARHGPLPPSPSQQVRATKRN